MRHNKKFNHLGRTASHRSAMLANMAISLIMHKRITTTLAKAKALKKYVEPLITRSKEDTTNSRRVVFRYLQNKYAVTELFKEIWYKRETWNIVSLFLFVFLLGWLILATQIVLLPFSYFLIYCIPSLLLLFQALIRAVFYSFMSYSLVPFEQRGERYRNKKAIIKPLNTDYFLQKFDF